MPAFDKETIERLISFRRDLARIESLARLLAVPQTGTLEKRLWRLARHLNGAYNDLHWVILLGSAEGDDETSLSDNL